MAIRILIADDHPIFRDGVVRSLEETGEFRVVATASTTEEAVRLAEQKHPDLALLDLSMPGNGLTAVAAIAAAASAGKIAMLTVSEDEDHVAEALRRGATGYILKGVSAGELRRILKEIHAGEAHVSPGLAARVLAGLARPDPKPTASPLDDLTRREEEILRLVATGLSNKEIALELGLQEKTVKHHMTTIMGKIHARNRVEAAIKAHEAWSGLATDH